MKKKTSIIISSVAAVSLLASAFAFNSFAVEKPVDQNPITASNITQTQTNQDSAPTLLTEASTATNALKATPVSTTKYCPKTQNSTPTTTLNNIKSADITAPQNVANKSTCKNSTAKNINLSSIKARLEAFLKAHGIDSASIPGLNTSTTNTGTANKPATSTATTSKPTAKTPSTTTTSGNYSAFQKKVVELVNAERAKNGLKPLTMNAELAKTATLKSQDMAKLNYFSHTSPTYGSPFDMMKKYGISYRTAGENIAMGQTSPEQVMQGWMNSPGHRANILNSSFTQIGVGVAKNANGQLYWTQQFIG